MARQLVDELATRAERLANVLDDAPVVGDVISGRATDLTYHQFLRVSYQYVRASGPLLALTAAGLRRRGRYFRLAELAAIKSVEEAPHDRWALADLAACGGDVDDAVCAPIPRSILAYIQWVEALAESGSPAYLGAAYLLEGISWRRAGQAARRLCQAATIPHVDAAVTFLQAHGEADSAHVAVLDDVLATIDDPGDRRAVLASADVLATLYPLFFAGTGR